MIRRYDGGAGDHIGTRTGIVFVRHLAGVTRAAAAGEGAAAVIGCEHLITIELMVCLGELHSFPSVFLPLVPKNVANGCLELESSGIWGQQHPLPQALRCAISISHQDTLQRRLRQEIASSR